MQIEIEIKTKKKMTIDVSFPIFVTYGDTFDSGGGYDCYARIDENLTRYEIHEDYNGEWKFEVDKISKESIGRIAAPQFYANDFSDYYYTKIIGDTFYAKVAELKSALDSIPR